MRRRPHGSRIGQGGVALVAVLWIVAALSILVTGMVQAQRDEIRLVTSARQTVEGSALGNAAVQLALQQLVSADEPLGRLKRVDVQFAGHVIPVEVMPLTGLIDINRAPAPLLTALFTVAGGVDAAQAAELSKAVEAARAPSPTSRGEARFQAVEDLLQVPGVDFALYAKLSSLVTTDSLGRGRVNAMAAPEKVLLVLAEGATERAARIAANRDAGETGVDTTDLPAQFLDSAVTRRFRLVAQVPLPDGRRLLSTRFVDTGRRTSEGLPWRIFHAEDRFEPAPAAVN